MASQRTQRSLRRSIAAFVALAEHGAEGVRAADLVARLSVSQATVYRDLRDLENAGVVLQRLEVDGERRIALKAPYRAVRLGPDARTRRALSLLLKSLTALEGTFVEDALDAMLGGDGPPSARLRKTGSVPENIAQIERALAKGQRLRFQYRGAADQQALERTVDPIALTLSKGQWYLDAWDIEEDRQKTFKPARMSRVFVEPDRVRAHRVDLDSARRHSVGIWHGEPADIAVRIDASSARYVTEWPLHAHQTQSEQPDGSVIVRAKVNGLYEASRWVLSWGAKAEALEPSALRELVERELAGAIEGYRGRAKAGVSQRS